MAFLGILGIIIIIGLIMNTMHTTSNKQYDLYLKELNDSLRREKK